MRHAAVLLLVVVIAGCGESSVVKDERGLEHDMTRSVERSINDNRVTVTTACHPTTPSNDHWSCRTRVLSNRNDFELCAVTTEVRTEGDQYTWRDPAGAC